MPIPLQKGRLGRGLASLIGEVPSGEPRLPAEGEQRTLGIDQLHRSPLNPRRDFGDEELAELADSIPRLARDSNVVSFSRCSISDVDGIHIDGLSLKRVRSTPFCER